MEAPPCWLTMDGLSHQGDGSGLQKAPKHTLMNQTAENKTQQTDNWGKGCESARH